LEESHIGPQHLECAKTNCKERATHHIIVQLWPYGANQKTIRPIKMVLGAMLCERHAKHVVKYPVETGFINNGFWEMIDLRVHAANGLPIDRETMRVKAIKGSPAQHSMN
jgi:hypothetical protein